MAEFFFSTLVKVLQLEDLHKPTKSLEMKTPFGDEIKKENVGLNLCGFEHKLTKKKNINGKLCK